MESIGEELRKFREEKGITLDEAAKRTRIAKRYLEALEEERYQMLPDETYIITFLRSYADFLGMSGSEAIRLYRKEIPSSESDDDALWKDTPPEEEKRPAAGWIVAAVSVIVVCAAVYRLFLRG